MTVGERSAYCSDGFSFSALELWTQARADELKAERQAQAGDGTQVLDAEEYSTLMRIKDLKQMYR